MSGEIDALYIYDEIKYVPVPALIFSNCERQNTYLIGSLLIAERTPTAPPS